MSGFRPVDPKQSFVELEERVLERWREGDVFARQLAQRRDEGAPVWSFYEGPPTANGRPGSHHVLSRVFKDVYPRYRAMRGHYVPRKGGWDCHGLPVELEVEKELGISSKAEIEELGIAEFNNRCRESVFRYVEEWNKLTERIGFWVDLDDPYITLTDDYIESVWWSLRQIHDAGRLYEGHKVVPYCPRCGTALSSHEVAQGYRDVIDPSVYVRLPITEVQPSDAQPENALQVGDNLLVWTTTPWTLISHAAVAAGRDIEYVRARVGDAVYIVARPLVGRVLGEEAEILAHVDGKSLEGTRYEAPFDYIRGEEFGPLGHSVLLGDFVSTEDGTGLVHTALAFGEDDFRLGEQYEMTLQNPVRLDGTYDERVPDFQGKYVYEHNDEIVEALRAKGRLFRAEEYEHAYPHCWRSGNPLIYYAKASWYIRTTDVRDRMLEENEKIGWYPEHVKHGRFGKWLEGYVDWALSRERYWGTPLPVWRCEATDCDGEFCAGSVAELRERGGTVPDDLHRPYIDDVVLDCADCGGQMRRVPEVIDTWYDSGSMPFAQFHYPFEGEELFSERFPADYISEGQDQTRGWFYSQLAISTLLFDQSDFRNCVCLGLILDAEGQKMSKSRGNVVDPWDVIGQHGADAFRWYLLTAQAPWATYRFSTETVGESVRLFMNTLWNTYSFWVLYANTEDLGPADFGALEPGSDLDRWAVSKLQGVTREVIARMDDYDCTTAGRLIADYVDDLSNWYVRLSRRRFWEGDRAAFATLRHCLVEVAKLLAPFVPFLAEEVYSNLTGDGDSVHLADYPEPITELEDGQLESGVEAAMRAIELGRAARAQAKVKMRQPLRRAVIVATDTERAEIERLSDLVAAELNVKGLEFVSEQGELVSYEVKPNYRTLGPRFGKSMPQVAAAVSALDAERVAQSVAGERAIGINVDGSEHTLEPQDVSLVMSPLDGYEVEAEAGRAVALALELDDELRREGLAREVVHAIQNARKDAGLDVSDRISLTLEGDAALLDAARAHEEYVAGETLATAVAYGGATQREAAIEGRELRIGIEPGA
ncbi:MAG TPA: isoleucine--tRNA ligase [Solirubrobacterales bacterium]|nr:isoleucine--tRNA ligase [Solirubrobacterales bacterium]